MPAVDVSAARHVPNLLYVETDDAAIAGLAAEHLLGRGFRHFGYCGDPRFNWSNWREEHFRHRVAAAGFECHVYRPSRRRRGTAVWDHERADLGAWLQALPKPAGVMACYDIRGREVLDVCRQRGISVPDEVALIGVDNDDVICDLADPPLSSVIPDTRRTGYEAARLLDFLMAGRSDLPLAHLVPPWGVAVRGSTDVLATDDADVSAAVRFIRAHATEGINVHDVLRAVPLSRRVLETRYGVYPGIMAGNDLAGRHRGFVFQVGVAIGSDVVALFHRFALQHLQDAQRAHVVVRNTGLPGKPGQDEQLIAFPQHHQGPVVAARVGLNVSRDVGRAEPIPTSFCALAQEGHNQPPVKPARRSPATMAGQRRMMFQIRPLR